MYLDERSPGFWNFTAIHFLETRFQGCKSADSFPCFPVNYSSHIIRTVLNMCCYLYSYFKCSFQIFLNSKYFLRKALLNLSIWVWSNKKGKGKNEYLWYLMRTYSLILQCWSLKWTNKINLEFCSHLKSIHLEYYPHFILCKQKEDTIQYYSSNRQIIITVYYKVYFLIIKAKETSQIKY